MVKNLLCWPPGCSTAPNWRLNMLRRIRYCGDTPKCLHEDLACCCKGIRICGCPNWQGDCVTNILPDLTIRYEAPTCNASTEIGELDGLEYTLYWCDCLEMDGSTACTCSDYVTTPEGWYGWLTAGGPFSCSYNQLVCTSLRCVVNPDYDSATCFDYLLQPNFNLSGAHSTFPNTSYPSSCYCGNETEGFSLEYENIFNLNEVFPGSSGCCDGAPGNPFSVPFNAYITGPPRAFMAMATAAEDARTEMRHPGRTFSTPPPRAQRKPVEEEKEETELPKDVEDWLNGSEEDKESEE